MSMPALRFKEDDGREFPNWITSRLGDLVKIYDGTHMTPEYKESGIPFYSVEHLTNNDFKNTKFISQEVFEKENKRVKLEKGDILMTRIGDIGTPKYINWDVNASFYVSLALIKQSEKINPEYLSHFITSEYSKRELHKKTIHVAFPKKINLGEIGECLVRLPVQSEQTKIANFLTAIDEKITQLTQKHDLLTQYKKGVMQQIFSQELRFKDDDGKNFPEWQKKTIDAVADVTTGDKDTQNKIDNGNYPFFVRSQTVERINSYSIDGEAVLTSGDGVGVGKNYHYINGKFDFHQRVYCLYNFKSDINGKFVFHYFSEHFNKRVMQLSAKNSVDSVRRSMITDMPINVPSYAEQTKIANFLTALDEKITVTKSKLEAVKQYKQGLLQQIFI